VSDVLVGDVADVVEIETLGPTALIVHSLLRSNIRRKEAIDLGVRHEAGQSTSHGFGITKHPRSWSARKASRRAATAPCEVTSWAPATSVGTDLDEVDRLMVMVRSAVNATRAFHRRQ